jgi:hypothetical protein
LSLITWQAISAFINKSEVLKFTQQGVKDDC